VNLPSSIVPVRRLPLCGNRVHAGVGVHRVAVLAGRILMLVLALGAAGCDILTTRDPEPPTQGSSTFVPPTAPELVLANLRSAVSEKNVENYMRCLVDTLSAARSFQFVPTASALGRYPSAFLQWSLQSERTWFSSLLALTPAQAAASLSLDGGFSVIVSDSAVYTGTYALAVAHALPGVPETVRGQVQLVMALDRSSQWSIVRWTDTPVGTEPSWSEWKGRFGN
jgi:hypothetical protein